MSRLLLTFYADDFTGATDALEQLTCAGVRTMLFIQPPTPGQLARFKYLEAIGLAGKTRSMTPTAMEQELKPALQKLKALRPRHVHYKVCSTLDSSPTIGSIGRVMDLAAKMFPGRFIPILAAAPSLGRYTIFGNHFARYGIGSNGEIHRLDRHPSISKHSITPMAEADLRAHLAKQTKKRIVLFDILQVSLSETKARAALDQLLDGNPDVVLFDALTAEHMERIGGLIDSFASQKCPLFSVGSSGIETALAAHWRETGVARAIGAAPSWGRVGTRTHPAGWKPALPGLLVGSGSCSPVTCGQINWALKHGFAEVPIEPGELLENPKREILRATKAAIKLLKANRSVIIHTTRTGSDSRIARKFKNQTAKVLGGALGKVLRASLMPSPVRRVCISGGDTSSFAARALGIEALEMIAPLTPGAPLCRAHAPGSPIDQREVIFKGGQVGGEDYFGIALKGHP